MNNIKDIVYLDDIPKYIQISNKFKELIENGSIKDGEKLPPIRELSKDLDVNKITIVNAYKKLRDEGFAYQKIGSGTFAKKKELYSNFMRVYSNIFKLLKNCDSIDYVDFTGETTKEIFFPIKDFKEIITTVLDRDGEEVLLSQNTLGYDPLRETINKVFWNSSLNIEDILIVSGAQQGIDIASKAIVNINDNVIVEKPTYTGALSVFKWRRANIFEVPIEKDGINLELFEEILKKNKITLFYAMSYFQNPTGVSYSMEKKKKILELANKYDFYIIEDDYLSELIYEDINYSTFKSLDEFNRVIYIKSFSKIFIPGIRLGYIIVPEIFRESFLRTKLNTDITTSTLMQRALEYYIANKDWKENIRKLSYEYKERYDLMGKLIEDELSDYVRYNKPRGGLNYYLELKDKSISSRELFFKLKKKRVYITPGVLFFRDSNEGDGFFRIGFSQVDCENIAKGIKIIKEELKSWHT